MAFRPFLLCSPMHVEWFSFCESYLWLAVYIVFQMLLYRDEREAIESYFRNGHTYKVMLLFLSLYHGISLSLRTLKRRVQEYHLSRRRMTSLVTVWNTIQNELQGPGVVGLTVLMWYLFINFLQASIFSMGYLKICISATLYRFGNPPFYRYFKI